MNTVVDLTRQERTVLALVARGSRNAEIAQELYLSIHTVESHLHRIFKKFEVSSRTEAVFYALERGLLSKPKFNGTTHDRVDSSGYYNVIS
ncbi:MAG: LuxR C-terminal-related transcriptional regulator [Chloroflexota bacterium]